MLTGRALVAGRLKWCLPVILGFLVMVPRIASAQFGLFDDGGTRVEVRGFLEGNWEVPSDLQGGRFRPVYWLVPLAMTSLGGEQPSFFFLGNAVILAGTVACLMKFIRDEGGNSLAAVTAGVLFVLGGPAVESFYTLSKGEPIQVFGLALCLMGLAGSRKAPARLPAFIWLGVAGLGMAMALFSKETSLIMVPIALAWWLLLWVARTRAGSSVRSRGWYSAAWLIAAVIFLSVRRLVIPGGLTEGGYTDNYVFEPSRLAENSLRWAGWLVRDYAYLLPLAIGLTATRAWRRPEWVLLRESLVWCAGWLGIYLPWIFVVEYYLLPFSLGACVAAGIGVSILVSRGSRLHRGFALLLLVISLVLWGSSLANQMTNARIQLAVDSANEDMIQQVVNTVPHGSTVLLNIQDPNEYVEEISVRLLSLEGRDDLSIRVFQPDETAGALLSPDIVFVLDPRIVHQPPLAVRMGVYEPTLRGWNESLQRALGGRLREVFHVDRQVPLFLVELPRVFCALIPGRGYCGEGQLTDTQIFVYGWTLYRVQTEGQAASSGPAAHGARSDRMIPARRL